MNFTYIFGLAKKTWPIALIVSVVLLFFYPVWLERKIPLPADFVVGVYYPWLDYKWGYPAGVPVKNPQLNDVASFVYPVQMLTIDLLKKGEIPLWNPYILGGAPLLANFQSAAFSPANFLYFVFNRLDAWSISIIIQHVLAALFTYLLLRHWQVSKLGAVFGGAIFTFSGFNLVYSQWNGHVMTTALLPLVLFFGDRWLLQGRARDSFGLTISLSLQILSGYPQVVFYTFVAVAILWLLRLREIYMGLLKTILMGLFGILSLGITAFQVIPGYELVTLSQRVIEENEWVYLPWIKIITLLAPDFFGNPATQNYWGPQDYTSNIGFVGVVTFVLATIAVINTFRVTPVKYAILLSVSSLALALETPVSVLLWETNFLGLGAASAFRAMLLFNFSIAILAGFGIDYFLSSKGIRVKQVLIAPYLILGGFGLVTTYLYLSSQGTDAGLVREIPAFYVAIKNLIFPSSVLLIATTILIGVQKFRFKKICLISILVLLCFELFRFGWKFTPFVPSHIVFPATPVLDFISSRERPFRVIGGNVIPINMRMPYKLESLDGYDAIYPVRVAKFLAALNSGRSDTTPMGRYGIVNDEISRLHDLTNAKYYLVIKRDEQNKPSPEGKIPKIYNPSRFQAVFEDKSVTVLENKDALPRAFMVYDWETVRDEQKILDRLLDHSFPIDKKIILDENVSLIKPGIFSNTVKYLSYEEQESIVKVNTESHGLLFVSDTWYPSWRAYVDGKETKIYRANYAFRAVAIPTGEHEVKFIYKPDSFYDGIKVSSISFVALLFSLLFFKWRYRWIN